MKKKVVVQDNNFNYGYRNIQIYCNKLQQKWASQKANAQIFIDFDYFCSVKPLMQRLKSWVVIIIIIIMQTKQ